MLPSWPRWGYSSGMPDTTIPVKIVGVRNPVIEIRLDPDQMNKLQALAEARQQTVEQTFYYGVTNGLDNDWF